MEMTIARLTDIFHELILARFQATTPARNDAPFLAFEFGTPIPDEVFRDALHDHEYSPALALEYLSHHANVAPKIRDTMFVHTGSTVDGQYEMLLFGSTPTDEAAFDLFARVKNAAGAAFDDTLGSSLPPGTGRYHAVHADPVNWYDQSAGGNWTRLKVDGADQPTPGRQALPRDTALSKWRMVTEGARESLHAPVSLHTIQRLRLAPLIAASHASPGMLRLSSRDLDIHHDGTPIRPIDLCEVFNPKNTEKLFDCPVPPQPPPPVEKPVSSDGFSVEMDVCLVHLRRPWLSTNLLALTDWFVPGLERGTVSGGKGVDDAGSFGVLPIACVLVRNLVISARWSEDDLTNTVTSSHLGAFSLLGRSFDHNSATLTVPGMQSVAWLCEALPVLPPTDKP
jgi:hypothetical protein